MFRDFLFLEKILALGRKLIPRTIFEFFQPWYHRILALSGAVIFGFPSRKLKVIGVTGTKGKSTTVFLIAKFLEEALPTSQGGPAPVAAIGSLGYKIGDREWPNDLKMTMPGRWKMQKFLSQAVKAGCKFAVLEITSEGIKQKRHLGIKFDAAVFTNLEKEHLEAHGSFEKYYGEKQKLFKRTKNIHVLNADSPYVDLFSSFPSEKKVFYSLSTREQKFHSHLIGDFNKSNILAAAAVVSEYGVGRDVVQKALDKIKNIPGRMEFIEAGQDFKVVVDYAHTPGSLEAVYKTLRNLQLTTNDQQRGKLICVLGAAGGGRDKWKRPVFGQIAEKYCNEVILTNEDSYDENPEKIIDDIFSGISGSKFSTYGGSAAGGKVSRIIDRREAIKKALTSVSKGDIVIITGKGSETSIAVAGGKRIPWSDKEVVSETIKELKKNG